MRSIIRVLNILVLLFFGIMIHLGVSYILPSPWNSINILFLILVSIIYGWAMRSAVWLAFIYFFIIELYSTTPFGIILFSATISTMLAFWLYEHLFTNRSWYGVFFLSMVTLFMYRAIGSIMILGLEIFSLHESLPWGRLWLGYIIEAVLTSCVVVLLFFILRLLRVPFRTRPSALV